MIRSNSILITATMLIAVAHAAHAQTVRGVVVDDSTGEAVAGVEVFALDLSNTTIAFEVTGRDGRFVMSLPPGRYAFRALRMGFAPTLTPDLEISDDSPPIDLTILLPSERVVLDPVVVTDTVIPYAPRPLEGFYERKRRGWGLHITREEIEEKAPGQFTDILRGLPGVRVVGAGRNKFVVQMVGQVPRLQVNAYSARDRWRSTAVRDRDAANTEPTAGACPVTYYVDGDKFVPDELGINEILVSEVEAVEVYRRASETPADFLDSDSRCGVVVIWTKRGT